MLAKNRRENLLPHVKEARKLVEDAFDRVLVGLGLPKDREPLPPERITNPDKLATRKAVDEVIARDREAGGMSYVDARRRYLEHCSFTLVNRVAALRAMEIRGFLTKSVIAQDVQYGGVSAWARDIVEAGTVEILGESIPIRTADEARWQAIRAACVAASRDVAIVFDLQDEYMPSCPNLRRSRDWWLNSPRWSPRTTGPPTTSWVGYISTTMSRPMPTTKSGRNDAATRCRPTT